MRAFQVGFFASTGNVAFCQCKDLPFTPKPVKKIHILCESLIGRKYMPSNALREGCYFSL